MLLKWIAGNRVDHPFSDIAKVREVIAGLPHDRVKALDEITQGLESLNDAGFKPERLYEIVDLLDAAARNPHRKLLQDYLASARQQKIHENRFWTCGSRFAKALGEAYQLCAREHGAAPKAKAAQQQLPVSIARALRALGLQMKWAMLRYAPIDARVWTAAGGLYDCAESGGYATRSLMIYSGVHGSGCVEGEYLKIMLLCASNADVLAPLKQDIAERAVAYVAGAFRLQRTPFPGAIYCFDPTRDERPVRMFAGPPTAGKDICYFSAGDAAARLERIVPVIEKTGALPSDVNLGGTYPGDLVLSVFRHLCQHWSDKPPARISERRAATARITVVPGFAAVVRQLERTQTASLDFDDASAESWIVENESDNGYGALVPSGAADWVRAGELFGVQGEGIGPAGVALVRRVMRDGQRRFHVGIEVISRIAHVVHVAHGAGNPSEAALLLCHSPDRNGEVKLLSRSGRFRLGIEAEMSVKGQIFGIAPVSLIEAGEDFEWTVYRVLRTP